MGPGEDSHRRTRLPDVLNSSRRVRPVHRWNGRESGRRRACAELTDALAGSHPYAVV